VCEGKSVAFLSIVWLGKGQPTVRFARKHAFLGFGQRGLLSRILLVVSQLTPLHVEFNWRRKTRYLVLLKDLLILQE